MKKRLVISLAVVTVLASAFVGCGKKVTCEECGEKKTGKTYEIMGEKVDLCNDCYKEYEDMIKALEALEDLDL